MYQRIGDHCGILMPADVGNTPDCSSGRHMLSYGTLDRRVVVRELVTVWVELLL